MEKGQTQGAKFKSVREKGKKSRRDTHTGAGARSKRGVRKQEQARRKRTIKSRQKWNPMLGEQK